MRTALTLIAFAALVITAVLVRQSDNQAISITAEDVATRSPKARIAEPTFLAPATATTAGAPLPQMAAEEPGDDPVDPPGCLRPDQLETHPSVTAEFETYESISSTGRQFDAYRQLSEGELEALAVQNDTAAMVMLGDKAVERTMGSSSRGNEYGLGAIVNLQTATNIRGEPLSSDQTADLETARYWYYNAALHGRVGALWQVGLVREILEGSAVDVGWISRQDYAKLSRNDQVQISPALIYERLSRLARPGAADLFGGQLLTDLSERQQQIVERLAQEFRHDRAMKGFADFDPIQSAISDLEQVLDLACPSMRDQL